MQWSEFSFILKPSLLSGIGVFATHDIPAGTILCGTGLTTRTMKIKDIPADFVKFCIFIDDENCFVPKRFDHMEIGWFINHSNTPNIATSGIKSQLCAITNIKAGDEILIDYNQLGEPEHLKEDFYKKTK